MSDLADACAREARAHAAWMRCKTQLDDAYAASEKASIHLATLFWGEKTDVFVAARRVMAETEEVATKLRKQCIELELDHLNAKMEVMEAKKRETEAT